MVRAYSRKRCRRCPRTYRPVSVYGRILHIVRTSRAVIAPNYVYVAIVHNSSVARSSAAKGRCCNPRSKRADGVDGRILDIVIIGCSAVAAYYI